MYLSLAVDPTLRTLPLTALFWLPRVSSVVCLQCSTSISDIGDSVSQYSRSLSCQDHLRTLTGGKDQKWARHLKLHSFSLKGWNEWQERDRLAKRAHQRTAGTVCSTPETFAALAFPRLFLVLAQPHPSCSLSGSWIFYLLNSPFLIFLCFELCEWPVVRKAWKSLFTKMMNLKRLLVATNRDAPGSHGPPVAPDTLWWLNLENDIF